MGLHIVKRENCPLWKKALFYLIAIAAALLVWLAYTCLKRKHASEVPT